MTQEVRFGMRQVAAWISAAALLVLLPGASRGEEPTAFQPATLDSTVEAGEGKEGPVRPLEKINSHDLGFTTFRFGYGAVVDFAAYGQDHDAEQQVPTESDIGLRDFRLLFKGRFNTRRSLTWTIGYMYNGSTDTWHFRQTGLMIGVPEISSSFFIGRTKEGYSSVKTMVGYDLWTVERTMFLDAFIPILADGVKWLGALPNQRLHWTLGWYQDWLSESESFNNCDRQLVGRLVWLPIESEQHGRVLHLGVQGRDVLPDDGTQRSRSRPEANLAPYFVDTGTFETDHAQTVGLEGYYRAGPLLLGGEYGWQTFDAPTVGDPKFHGGNASVVWLTTGETRGYNTVGGYFEAVNPRRTIFNGGPGAIELVMNFSYIDLDDGGLAGGKLWKLSPVAKWHLMYNMRIEVGYGVGELDRFGTKGTTQFFQARVFTAII